MKNTRKIVDEENNVYELDSDEYVVEKIVSLKYVNGIEYYEVKWKGYPNW